MNRKVFGVITLLTLAVLGLAACGTARIETPASTPAPTAPLMEIPTVVCCRGKALEAGRYALPAWLAIPLSVEIGEGWKVMNESRALLFLLGRGENVLDNPSQMIAFLNVTGKTTPEELIKSVREAPELTALSEPASVTVADFPGLQLDATAKPNPAYTGNAANDIPPGVQPLPVLSRYFTPGFLWTTSSPETRIRTIVLPVGDQTLLLYLEAPPGEFDQFAADASVILESQEWLEK
jgi:hypothetical protein